MPQPTPTSPLDSHIPSDEVRFDLHKGGEYLAPYEHIAEDRDVTEALQRALAAAAPESFAEEGVHTQEIAQATEVNVRELVPVSIEEMHKVGVMMRYVRDEELTA